MDNKANDLEDVLLDIFINNRIDPSKDWLNLPLKELIKQFENFKQQHAQSSISEKDRQKKAKVADGLCINALLTLMHTKSSLEKNEFAKYVNSASETSSSSRSVGYFVENLHAKNLDEISSWQKSRLIYVNDFFPSLLDSNKSIKDRYSKPEISMSYEPITEWERRHTMWQAAAQILWLDKEANIEKIKKKLLLNPKLFALLDLGILPSTGKCANTAEGEEIKFRALEDEIRKVNPRGTKKGRPRKNDVQSEHFVFIPLV